VVQNGDFENVLIGPPFVSANPADVPGWTHTGSPGDGLLWAVGYSDGGGNVTVAGHGNQFVTMGGGFGTPGTAGWTSTATGLVVGQQYQLLFDIADEGVPSLEVSPQTMTAAVTSGGVTSQSYTVPGTGNYWKNWVGESIIFTAGATTAVLDFSVTNQPYDMGLDDVRLNAVQAVPEPGSLSLIVAALAGLGLLRRWRTA
jgi:hypothetical protein